jgi:hypothetical protein
MFIRLQFGWTVRVTTYGARAEPRLAFFRSIEIALLIPIISNAAMCANSYNAVFVE